MKKILLSILTIVFLSNYHKTFSQDGKIIINCTEYPGAIRNPMKGLREFFAPGIDKKRDKYPYPYGSIIKEYMQWNMLENKVDDGVDKVISYSNHRWENVENINMKVIPRVFLVWLEPWHGGKPKDVNNADDLTGWHWPDDIPPQISPYKQIPGSVGAYVDSADINTPITGGYFDPSFPERVTKLVEKIGKAWDNDPRVAYVEMGIIGEWGEHHDPNLSTFWPPHDEPKHVANRTWIPGMEKVLGDAFTKAFKNKKVMIRYPYEFKDYEFGIYWDSWAQPQEIKRGYEEIVKLGDRWKTQPIGGEITWNWGDLAKFNSFEECVNDPKTREIIIEQIRNLHCNHLGGITWADFNNPDFKHNADILQKALGYRFVISEFEYRPEVTQNKAFEISFKVKNTGSSPFYYNWPVEISLLDIYTHEKVWSHILDKVNISEWMPGDNWSIQENRYMTEAPLNIINSTMVLDESVKDGQYILAISILDPAGNLPSIRFAIENYFEGGRHPIGYIGVNRKIKEVIIDEDLFFDIQSDKSLRYIVSE